MINKSNKIRFFNLSFVLAGFVLVCGGLTNINAQNRDPFNKPGWAKPRVVGTSNPGTPKAEKPKPPGPPPIVAVGAPPIQMRINYYKKQREEALTNGQDVPKVTSVLTLDEMAVTGIFRTPRGYAAMVEAKPINLSYTIYPGEKFFDGQLVAVEENRLVFRRVVKMSDGKFLASVENKTLRQYTIQEEVQGTAPVQPSSGKTEEASNMVVVPTEPNVQTIAPSVIISPLDEMNNLPVESAKDKEKDKTDKTDKKGKKQDAAKSKSGSKTKKSVKVADNKGKKSLIP